MRRLPTVLGLLVLVGVFSPLGSAQQPTTIARTPLKAGDQAPNFTLLSDKWQPVKLSDFRGKKNVILAIYVLAFTPG